MAAAGNLDRDDLIALTKQALGNRTTGLYTDAWYIARVESAYSRLCTFQGVVMAPGMRRPRFRALRFFELYVDTDADIDAPLAHNFITPSTSGSVVYVDNIYDLTNDRSLHRKAIRYMHTQNPDTNGTPREWSPGGRGGVTGYYLYPVPTGATDTYDISVRERTYEYPAALALGSTVPVIPAAWHKAIWLGAAAEGATLADWPEKAAEMEQLFMTFISERRSPVEESGAAGGRRHFNIGGL